MVRGGALDLGVGRVAGGALVSQASECDSEVLKAQPERVGVGRPQSLGLEALALQLTPNSELLALCSRQPLHHRHNEPGYLFHPQPAASSQLQVRYPAPRPGRTGGAQPSQSIWCGLGFLLGVFSSLAHLLLTATLRNTTYLSGLQCKKQRLREPNLRSVHQSEQKPAP